MEGAGEFVLPGQTVVELGDTEIKIGKGLKLDDDDSKVVSTQPGILMHDGGYFHLSYPQKKYTARLEDPVIGIVTQRVSDNGWTLDICAHQEAYLDALSFDGATGRTKPRLEVGDVVHCRVSQAHSWKQPVVVCTGSTPEYRKDWVSGWGIFGELKDGYVFEVSIQLATRLIGQATILETIGKKWPYEVAVGINGRVWVRAETAQRTILVMNAIKFADNHNNVEFMKNLELLANEQSKQQKAEQKKEKEQQEMSTD
eukprot:TRINITY_DN54456_c0_g1_i2.p1 TRINITY_DN54456_c0_g1~~TRINITY_DN54456_c0_g1_i2.p1  ORF type:complete len:256 (+),score=24.87 TRINITY_DN54456_c0_g1_i2:27-794(+)